MNTKPRTASRDASGIEEHAKSGRRASNKADGRGMDQVLPTGREPAFVPDSDPGSIDHLRISIRDERLPDHKIRCAPLSGAVLTAEGGGPRLAHGRIEDRAV